MLRVRQEFLSDISSVVKLKAEAPDAPTCHPLCIFTGVADWSTDSRYVERAIGFA